MNLMESIFTVKYIKLSVMKKNRKEDLADYLRRVLEEKRLTLREVEERSGRRITHGYLSRILNRTVRNLTVDKLKALAKGLGVPEVEVFTAARGASPDLDPEVKKSRLGALFYKFDTLSEEDKRVVEALMETIEREIERRSKK